MHRSCCSLAIFVSSGCMHNKKRGVNGMYFIRQCSGDGGVRLPWLPDFVVKADAYYRWFSPHLLLVDCVLSSLHLFNFLPATMSQENQPSLLIPPNPSLSQQKPSASILLNGPNRPRGPSSSTAPDTASQRSLSASSFTGSHSPVSSLTSVFSHASGSGDGNGSGDGSSPSPPDHSSSPYSSHDSLHTNHAKQLGYNYTAPSSPAPSRRASQAKIHFAPLPAVPPEFRRRNSISLGVASRRNLIGMQGHGQKGGVQSVVMSDEDWDNYCKQFEEKHG